MIRNLKVMGFIWMAVFALNAVAASAVMAEGAITSSEKTVKLTGTDVGPITEGGVKKSTLIFEKEQEIRCHGHYTIGNVDETEPGTEEHGWTDLPTSEVTATPDYTKCRVITGVQNLPATATRNGCDYDFSIINTSFTGLYNGKVDVTCPEGKSIVFDAYSNETHTTQVCTFTLSAQSNKTGSSLNDNGGVVAIGGKTTGITLSRTGILCKGTKTTHVAELEAEVEVTATNEKGEPVPIEVSD